MSLKSDFHINENMINSGSVITKNCHSGSIFIFIGTTAPNLRKINFQTLFKQFSRQLKRSY